MIHYMPVERKYLNSKPKSQSSVTGKYGQNFWQQRVQIHSKP